MLWEVSTNWEASLELLDRLNLRHKDALICRACQGAWIIEALKLYAINARSLALCAAPKASSHQKNLCDGMYTLLFY